MIMPCKKPRAKRLALLALCLAIPCGAATGESDWRIEQADLGGGGKFSSLQIDANGNVHVAYFDEANGLLKYAVRDYRLHKWFTTTLDKSGGFCSLVLDSKQRPHISYQQGTGKLAYIYWNGTAWVKQPLDIKAKDISFYTSIALDANDNPRIAFYEYWGTGEDYELHLRNIRWTGDHWEVGTIDPTPGSGKFNSIAAGSSGQPQIAYANVKSENQSLRYAIWNGASWVVSVLEGVGSPHPVCSVRLALDKKEEPHIVYTDQTTNTIKYAAVKNGKWEIQIVDRIVEYAWPDRNGIALTAEGVPYISYYDAGAGRLKVAHPSGGRWVAETVDGDFAGYTSSLQIANGYLWMTYADGMGQTLRFAYRKLVTHGDSEARAALPIR